MRIARAVALITALVAGPLYFGLAALWSHYEGLTREFAYDTTSYFYPNVLYALRSFDEGAGLWWNSLQNCGQPFFAFSLTGLLYPLNFVFFVLDREHALLASTLLNLVLGGWGAWLLLREYRLSASAALCGALAFQLSTPTLQLGAWSPMHIGPYVWMPWALFGLERILQCPSLRRAAALAGILAIQLLPGFPQISLFTLQLIALRIVWAIVFGQVSNRPHRPHRLRLAVSLLIAFGATPLLVAVQYLPALEVAAESIRASGVDLGSVRTPALQFMHLPTVLAAMLGGAGLVARRNRTLVAFYLAAALLFFVLSLGSRTPLFDLYIQLPLGDLFIRRPERFLWVTNLAFSVLVAFGVDSLRDASTANRRLLYTAGGLLGAAAAAVALNAITPTGLTSSAWVVVVLALAAASYVAIGLPGRSIVLWLLVLAVPVSALQSSSTLVVDGGDPSYDRHAELFRSLKGRLTSQDRVFLDARSGDFPFITKLSSIFETPGITDYEPQTSRRYAEYTVRMIKGRPMRKLNDFLLRPHLASKSSKSLLNLTAARYIVVPEDEPRRWGWKRILQSEGLALYENAGALPRAFFVPRAKVVSEARTLGVLANKRHDPRTLLLLEQPPASGFLGSEGATGVVDFLEDSAERVVLDVTAQDAGFVHLADQYFPGWRATVNGEPTTILRANHVFRAVPVAAGKSQVVFEYRPTRVYLGAGISLATLSALLLLCSIKQAEPSSSQARPEPRDGS